jgi:hypothetical protein
MHLNGSIHDNLAHLVLWNHLVFTFNAKAPGREDAKSLGIQAQPSRGLRGASILGVQHGLAET